MKRRSRKHVPGGKRALDETMKKPQDEIEKAEEAASAEDLKDTQEAPEAPAQETAQQEEDQLAKAQRQAEEYLEMAQRVQADFDNFRRRNASVRAEAYEDGAREAVKLFLPVLDNLERALEA